MVVVVVVVASEDACGQHTSDSKQPTTTHTRRAARALPAIPTTRFSINRLPLSLAPFHRKFLCVCLFVCVCLSVSVCVFVFVCVCVFVCL